uniref:CCHC-type domain-containing protein n=1 Tax=Trichogramma kaykai TaxID=54128 RepID=A0ABD2XFI2_9HYME
MTQLENFDIGEESISLEIDAATVFVCTESRARHEVTDISEETWRVVAASIAFTNSNLRPGDNTDSTEAKHDEEHSNVNSVVSAKYSGESSDKSDPDEHSKELIEMTKQLNARIAGKFTPSIKESFTFKGSNSNVKSNILEFNSTLEKENEHARKKIEISANDSTVARDLAHFMYEKFTTFSEQVINKLDMLNDRCDKLEGKNPQVSVRDPDQFQSISRDMISQTIREEMNRYRENSSRLDVCDKIQIQVSNGESSSKRNYKLTNEVRYEIFYDFLSSELTLCDLLYVIDSVKYREKNLSEEQLEKNKIRVRDLIINRIDISYYSKVSHLRVPVKLLERINELKLNETAITPSVLRKRLYNIRYNPSKEKASAFWDRFDNLVMTFNRSPGVHELSEDEVRDALFDAIVHAIPQVRDTQCLHKFWTGKLLSISQLKEYITQQESAKLEKLEGQKLEVPSAAIVKVQSRPGEKACFTCGNKGHL